MGRWGDGVMGGGSAFERAEIKVKDVILPVCGQIKIIL